MPKITDLTAATSVGATDVIPIVQSGTTKKLTATTLTGFAKTAAETSAGVTPSNLSYRPGDVRRYGGDPTGVSNSATAIQTAFDIAKSAGQTVYFGGGTYLVNSAITLQRASSSGPEQYVVEGEGATLDFSGSGITSGALFTLGATSQANAHDTGFIHLSNLKILGPETGNPFAADTPAGSTVGLSLVYCFNATLTNVYVQGCYIGVQTTFTFPLRANSLELKSNYIGLYVDDDSTLARYGLLSVTSARYGVVIRPSTTSNTPSNQHFDTPRFEQCLVGAVLDPRSGSGVGINSVVFDSPYLEDITYDYFRLGLQWTFANPGTRNSDATRDVYAVRITGGLWSGTWSGTKAPLVVNANVKGGQFMLPTAKSNVVGSLSNSSYHSIYDTAIGDSSEILIAQNAVEARANQPCFSAYLGSQAANVTGDGTAYDIAYNTEDFDVGANHYLGTYTAPFTGKYFLTARAALSGLLSGHTTATLKIIATGKTHTYTFNPYAISVGGAVNCQMNAIVNMTAADTAKVQINVSGSTKVVDIDATNTVFAGYFLG